MGLISIVSFLSSAQSLWHSSPLWQTRSTVEAKSKLSPPLEPKKKKNHQRPIRKKKPKNSFTTGNLIITCSRIALKPQVYFSF